MKKKRVLIASNFCLSNTGFAKCSKNLLTYLYKTGKYEIAEMCIGGVFPFEGHEPFKKTPWKTYGSLPRDNNLARKLLADKDSSSALAYGYHGIDDVVKDFEPDNIIFVEDPWAGANLHSKPWWDQINCYFWTTVDSLPILPLVENQAKHMKNYAVWAPFAKEALDAKLDKKVDCLFAPIDISKYYPIPDEERKAWREKFHIKEDEFVVFMNSRNQLRKYFYSNIKEIAGINNIAKGNPKAEEDPNIANLPNVKFLVNTSFTEGWDLMAQCEEYGLDKNNFICSYTCSVCDEFFVSPFQGDPVDCPFCKSEKSFTTPSTKNGLSEEGLNVLYNISDFYSLPISSGGFEITLLEALAVGLPIGTVSYASGSLYVGAPEAFFYEHIFSKEINSGFNKAILVDGTIEEALIEYINLVWRNKTTRKEQAGKNRTFALDKFDPYKTLKFWEGWIDTSEKHSFDFKTINSNDANPDFEIEEDDLKLLSDGDFVELLYNEILLRPPDPKGKEDWMKTLREGFTRENMVKFFLKQAGDLKEETSKQIDYSDYIEENGRKKLGYVITGSKSDCIASLPVLSGLLSNYPLEDWDHYVVTNQEFFPIFDLFNHIVNLIPYSQVFDHFAFTEGVSDKKGLFDVCLTPYLLTQGNPCSFHHGKYK